MNKVLFKIKPKFIFHHQYTVPLVIFFIVIFSISFIYLVTLFPPAEASAYWNRIGMGLIICTVCMFIFGIIFAIITSLKEDMYKQITFEFFADKALHTSSFVNHKKKEVSYSKITEVLLRRNVVQRYFNLGTISLLTNASDLQAGIKVVDIENPKECYDNIKHIIDKFKNLKNSSHDNST